MSELIIRINPNQQKRLKFDHPLVSGCKRMEPKDTALCLEMWLETGHLAYRDALVSGHMWLVEDFVSRMLAYWPETHKMIDDMVSEGLLALIGFTDSWEPEVGQDHQDFFYGCTSSISDKIHFYINDNRSTFSASFRTNRRRQEEGRALEYNFAVSYRDELTGKEDEGFSYVEFLDAVERLAETDSEEMYNLVLQFMEQDLNICEAELTDAEREAVEKLSKIGESLL